CPTPVEFQELSELVYNHPSVARIMVDIHRRYRNARDKLSLATDTRRTRDGSQALSMPHDEVRDFFYARQNYLDELDNAAEALSFELGVSKFKIRDTEEALVARLKNKHNVEVITTSPLDGTQHSFDAETGVLALASRVTEGERSFRMAAELSFRGVADLLNELTDSERCTSKASLNLARRGIASYFAAATLMPYDTFHTEAEQCGYDIEYLCQVF